MSKPLIRLVHEDPRVYQDPKVRVWSGRVEAVLNQMYGGAAMQRFMGDLMTHGSATLKPNPGTADTCYRCLGSREDARHCQREDCPGGE